MLIRHGEHLIFVRRNREYSAYWRGTRPAGVHPSAHQARAHLDTLDKMLGNQTAIQVAVSPKVWEK